MQEGDVLGVKDLQDINLEMDDNTVDNQGHTTLYLEGVDGCTEIVHIFFKMVPSQNLYTILGGHHFFTVAEKGQVEGHQDIGEKGY